MALTEPGGSAVFTRKLGLRLALGWVAALTAWVGRGFLSSDLPLPLSVGILATIVVVILVCSSGVVAQAERLARVLGDPYGTLILSVTIALIEVVLIAAVMLGPGSHPTIARDSIMAVTMIIMNLVVGAAILIRLRNAPKTYANRLGVSRYLGFIAVLQLVAFVLPDSVTDGGQYSPVQMGVAAVFAAGLYGVFLALQVGPWKAAFQEPPGSTPPKRYGGPGTESALPRHPQILTVMKANVRELALRTVALVALMIPVIYLSDSMAHQLDYLVAAVGAPVALSGLLIAVIVFLPETLTTFAAARMGEAQRASNLTHGALLSTMGITIPVVFTVSLLSGAPALTGETSLNLVFLAVTLILSLLTFRGRNQTALMGWAHIGLFAFYLGSLFIPG